MDDEHFCFHNKKEKGEITMPALYYTAPSEKNKDQFVRDAFIELYSASDAPVEIDEVEFSEPVVEPALLVAQVVKFDVSYSTEVGYHRREQYLEEEKYYDADLKKYRTRNVVKERTVTDWQPYRGDKQDVPYWQHFAPTDGDSQDIGDKDAEIASKYNNYRIDVESVLENVDGVLTDPKENELFYEPDDQWIASDATRAATATYFHNYLLGELPGDEHRNFNCDWTPTGVITAQYLTERYKLGFDFKGHKCFIKQCATEENPQIYCSYRHVDEVAEKIRKEKEDAKEDPTFQKNAKLYKYLTLGSLAGFVLSIGLSGLTENATISISRIVAMSFCEPRS